jgi:ATP adenylyltransferase
MASAYQNLLQFLQRRMRMSDIYQPLMIRTLLQNNGSATTRQIAAAFLAEDQSQLEYYETIISRMPGPVLRRHGVVAREGDGYRLTPEFGDLSAAEAVMLMRVCDQALADYMQKRGARIWEHRNEGLGRVPGKERYDTLKRAGFRCELCGVPADERAIDVDHILPRKHGGTDAPENLQALCWLCNTNKGAGDATDFRGVRDRYTIREVACLFCSIEEPKVVASNSLAIAIRDSFPVTAHHTLVLPRRHVMGWFDLYRPERTADERLLDDQRLRYRPSARRFRPKSSVTLTQVRRPPWGLTGHFFSNLIATLTYPELSPKYLSLNVNHRSLAPSGTMTVVFPPVVTAKSLRMSVDSFP